MVGAEPAYTIFTDQARGVRDYVWYTGDNLNANSALHVRRRPPPPALRSARRDGLLRCLRPMPQRMGDERGRVGRGRAELNVARRACNWPSCCLAMLPASFTSACAVTHMHPILRGWRVRSLSQVRPPSPALFRLQRNILMCAG